MSTSDGSRQRHPYYSRPGVGTPDNLPGISGYLELAELKRARTVEAAAKLRRLEPPARFDRAYLQSLHATLYEQIYAWAGELRAAELGDVHRPGEMLLAHERLGRHTDGLLGHQLAREGELRGLGPREWADRAAYYLATLDRSAPFYDGTRETVKMFGAQLAKAAGHELDWDRLAQDELPETLRHAALTGLDYQPLRESLLRGIGHSTTPYVPPPTSERMRPESKLANLRTDLGHVLGGLRTNPKPPDLDQELGSRPPPASKAFGQVNHVDFVLARELADLTAGKPSKYDGYLRGALGQLPTLYTDGGQRTGATTAHRRHRVNDDVRRQPREPTQEP